MEKYQAKKEDVKKVFVIQAKFLSGGILLALLNALSHHFGTKEWTYFYTISFFAIVPYIIYQFIRFAKISVRLKEEQRAFQQKKKRDKK